MGESMPRIMLRAGLGMAVVLECLAAVSNFSTTAVAQTYRACKTLQSGNCAVGRSDVPCPIISAPIGGTYPSVQAVCDAIRNAQEPDDLALCIERPILGCPPAAAPPGAR